MATSTAPTPSTDADALIVAVDNVRRITNFDGPRPDTSANVHQLSQENINAPGPCRATVNNNLVFDNG
ncbi:hypothetical protein [Mycobacterium leprae]|nr:hypothetical protein [Mycobacterium leprae]OAR19637.1 hypothetical protein A8144_04180 [Mycobacterium leprae 3125609]OAX71854.1 hypothetical protein A3216_03490 [Mycobacterium leprae 7935681]